MPLIELNKNPSRQELFIFGALFALFFGLIAGLIWWKFHAATVAYVVWSIAAAITFVFYALPPIRKPLYLGWIYLAYPIGWVISHTAMALIYYLVFTPIGLTMRLLGRDPMERRFDRSAASYWVEHDPAGEPGRYFRQF